MKQIIESTFIDFRLLKFEIELISVDEKRELCDLFSYSIT